VLLLFAWQQRARRHRDPLIPFGVYTDRNFALMSGVVAAISFGMLGLFLPLVIFLQSVLSLSPLQAGLVLAPMSLASIAAAPFADRYGGKDMLIVGLVLWAGGIALVLWATRLYYDRRELIAGLVIAGLGLGMTFAPLQSIAMRNIRPRVASSAAGLMNASRQLGALLGSAITGVLLQAQLAAGLDHRRVRTSRRAPVVSPVGARGVRVRGQDRQGSPGRCRPDRCPPAGRPAVVGAPRHRTGGPQDLPRCLHPRDAHHADHPDCGPRRRRHRRAVRPAARSAPTDPS
jgi:Major Facilitator Superfamily